MKYIAVTLISLMLSGCWYQVDSWELANMQKNCESHGGVSTINTIIIASGRCADGQYVPRSVPK